MIGGSIAAIAYGEPRLTIDVDFVLFLSDSDIQRIIDIFPESDFYELNEWGSDSDAKFSSKVNLW